MAQVGHIPFLFEYSGCKVKSIAESRPSLVRHIREQYAFDDIVSDYRELLADDEIDAVVLSAPRPATGPMTLDVLEAGKHVLAEKPMAHSVAQAKRLVDAAAARNLLYAVGYMKRYDPGIIESKRLLQEFLESGELGPLLSAYFYDHSKSYAFPPPPHQRPRESRVERFETWPLAPDWMPEGRKESFAWFMNSASHDVNLISYFFRGPLEVESASISSNQSVVSILSSGETLITLNISPAQAGAWVEGAEFVFAKGRLLLQVPSPMNIDGVTSIALQRLENQNRVEQIEVPPIWSFENQIREFIDALRGKSYCGTTGAQGMEDLELIENIWRQGLDC